MLRAHIAVDTAVFPAGTTGYQLDAVARMPLWQAGLDYRHGRFAAAHTQKPESPPEPHPARRKQNGLNPRSAALWAPGGARRDRAAPADRPAAWW